MFIQTCMTQKCRPLIPLGFEPRTFRVLGERDNHYTMESHLLASSSDEGLFFTTNINMSCQNPDWI